MKHKFSNIAGSALLTVILIYSVYGVGQSFASGIYATEEKHSDIESSDEDYNRAALKQNPLYKEECGSCHMAYPAEFLPPESWQRIISGLESHFGENAEIDRATRRELRKYLQEASGSSSNRKLLRNFETKAPLRITELPYFKSKHDRIPSKFVEANDKVASLSQCNACHRKAEHGRFNEDDVVIPGFGRWDD